MDEIISYKMCAVKVRNAKLRNYLNSIFGGDGGGFSTISVIFFVLMLRRPPFCFKNLVYPSLRAPIDQYIARRSEHEKNFKY
jgi:hypothetical protein